MGRERRKWTPQEDQVLREAVEQADRASRQVEWQTVASRLPGRTNKDCRKRWHNSLADNGNEGVWSVSEDERLKNAVRSHGTKWARVSADVRTRNGDQCSKRWSHSVNPNLDRSPWNQEEDKALLGYIDTYGHNWQAIVTNHLPHRSALSAKNRHFLLNRKSKSKTSSKSPTRVAGYAQYRSNVNVIPSSSSADLSPNAAPTISYTTSPIRTTPLYVPHTQIGIMASRPLYSNSITTYEHSPTYGAHTHVSPNELHLHNDFFPSPDVLPSSISPHATGSSPPSISPDSAAPSYTGSFSQTGSHTFSHQSSPLPFHTVSSEASTSGMMHSYTRHGSVSNIYTGSNAYANVGNFPGSTNAYTGSPGYGWPMQRQGSGDGAEEGGEGLENERDAMQPILIEAECQPSQMEPLMQSINVYARSATWMPRRSP